MRQCAHVIVRRQRDRRTKYKLDTLDFFLIFGKDALLCIPDINIGEWIAVFCRIGTRRATLLTVRHVRSGEAGGGGKKDTLVAPVDGNLRDW
jgi:hypothetical protein